MIRRTAPWIAALMLLPAPAQARTWSVGVGGDFPRLAAAVASASEGDVLRVRAGVYREDLVIDKALAIVGEGYPVISGTGLGTVVTIRVAGCRLEGLVIEGSGTGAANTMDAAVQVMSDGNRIVGNRIRRTFYGIVVANSAGNEILDNEIAGLRGLAFGRRGDGIYLYRAPHNEVARNQVSGERDAIYFQYAPRGRAVDNVVSDSRYALHDMFSDETVIARNVFSDSAVGANIMNSRRIRLEHNRILRNRGIPGVGLALKDCDDSIVSENEIVENARGLLIEGSSANRFAGNTFRANDTAVSMFSSAERNVFGGNQFLDNWSDLVLSGRDSGTRWTIDGRGNYWSRYRGFDFDGDGIGDAPHGALGPFERLEGANPAARLFLRSPAAAGLELAARLAGQLSTDAVDEKPLVKAPRSESARAHLPWTVVVAVSGLMVWLATGRRDDCADVDRSH